MGCDEFSKGRRVSEVEREKLFQRRHVWLNESRRLGYDQDRQDPDDSDREGSLWGGVGDESGTDAEPADVPTRSTRRRRSGADYSADVFESSNRQEQKSLTVLMP